MATTLMKPSQQSRDRPNLAELTAFLAVATHRSFRRAAVDVGLKPSSLSHMMRALEEKLGVRLLNRTTRSVATTEAGEWLVVQLRPVLRDLDGAIAALSTLGEGPSGTLRINAAEAGARILLETIVPTFLERHPNVTLDLVTEGRIVDIVELGFDAGVRLGDAVPRDMIAVRLGGKVRFLAVASPSYLAANGAPRAPEDLRHHHCIRIRLPSGKPYRWEFERKGRVIAVDVPGALILDDVRHMAEAAAAGLGIGYVPEPTVAPLIAAGALVTVLEDWSPPGPGLVLYYPANRHVPPPLRAFIDVVTELRSRRRA